MRQVLALDAIDPLILDVKRWTPPAPDPNEGWFRVWQESKVVADKPAACIGADKTCPCQDGDSCHYTGAQPFPFPPVVAAEWVEFSQAPPEPGLYEILAKGVRKDMQWFSRYFGDGKWSGRHELLDQAQFYAPSYESSFLAVGGGCLFPWTHYRRAQ